jgi:isocitrate dehydrogenase
MVSDNPIFGSFNFTRTSVHASQVHTFMTPPKYPANHKMEGRAPTGRPSYKIASIPADGIGPEVISAGIQVLKTLAENLDEFSLEFEHFEWSSTYFRKHGKYLPDDALEILKTYDAILFGAVGHPGLSPFFSRVGFLDAKWGIDIEY